MKQVDLKPIGEAIKTVCGMSLYALLMASIFGVKVTVTKKHISDSTYGYDDAVEAIMSSSMLSSQKSEAVSALKQNGDEHFYKAIYRIVNSSMLSSQKVEVIRSLSEK